MISLTLFLLLIIATIAYLRQRDRADAAEYRRDELHRELTFINHRKEDQ